MASVTKRRPRSARLTTARLLQPVLAFGFIAVAACGPSTSSSAVAPATRSDPRVGLKAGLTDAGQVAQNLKVVSTTPSPEGFNGVTNSDMAFSGHYLLQGNYNGVQIWDVSNPSKPVITKALLCPASQSDVSAYKNLMFISAEGNSGRVDCGTQGVKDSVSADRIRGIRIFDITDIANPKYITSVQTCRGSHTHTVVTDPKDKENVYIYVSGSAGVRSPTELPGCSRLTPDKDPNSALFRIEVIKVPLAHPEQAAIVSSPRIFEDLLAPPRHGEAPEDIAASKKAAAEHRAKGGYTAMINGQDIILPNQFINPQLDSIVKARGGTGTPTGADSAALRSSIQATVDKLVGANPPGSGPRRGPTQCHDITVYPSLGLAGGACEGYGILLDISDVTNPKRIDAVSDSNFSYWHSATFNNDGSKMLFSDEWGGGGGPKCRSSDKPQWGANAIFTRTAAGKMEFKSYYKMPAAQTAFENCVAHNGSLIPVPGRDIMVQAWYQGGISVFDFTDAAHPKEIAFFDRGPIDSTKMASGGAWSTYWYNGNIYSSEIARGLDVFELSPSTYLTQNEIDAAKSVKLEYFNAQEQPKVTWPPTFALSRAYLDQLERSKGLSSDKISAARSALDRAEKLQPSDRFAALNQLATQLTTDAASATDQAKVQTLGSSVKALANAQGLVAQPSN